MTDIPCGDDHAARDRALFERIASKYARKDLARASRIARRQRLRRTLAHVPPLEQPRVLEAGCGAGFSVDYLDRPFATFLGVDYSENLIAYARHEHQDQRVAFHVADLSTYRPDQQFELIFMIGVLHHFDNMPATMRRIADWLAPGGWCAANEPQSGNPLVQGLRSLRKRIDRNYSADQAVLSSRRLRTLFRDAGLVDVRVRPQGIFSTPFAEVVLSPQLIATPASALACLLDTALESVLGPLLTFATWNLVALGRKPARGENGPAGERRAYPT